MHKFPPNQSIARSLPGLVLTAALLPLSAIAATQPDQLPTEPKWGAWRPASERRQANFDSGFSNMQLGGYMEFQAACQRDTGLSEPEIEYWFRLSHLLDQIGTGEVETGCWYQGQFLHTNTGPAIRTDIPIVECLRVTLSPEWNGLNIRSDAGVNNARVGFVPNGQTVKVESSPASIIERDGRYWVAISQPATGWVSNDRPGESGNLRICTQR